MPVQPDGGVATVNASEEQEKFVDLSPEAQEAARLVKKAAPNLIDPGRVQAIVEEWRKMNPTVDGVFDGRGNPIRMPAIVVTEKWCKALEAQVVPLIHDCCEDSKAVIVRKIEFQKRNSHVNGGTALERLETALAGLKGRIVVPPTPG